MRSRGNSPVPSRSCRLTPDVAVIWLAFDLKDFGVMEYRELIAVPYRIFYRITGQVVSILGVLDGRRDLEEMLVNRALETDALE